MSDRMPDRMPDRMWEYMSERMPDRMPDRMSEYIQDMSKSWHVMVGITRRKVFFLKQKLDDCSELLPVVGLRLHVVHRYRPFFRYKSEAGSAVASILRHQLRWARHPREMFGKRGDPVACIEMSLWSDSKSPYISGILGIPDFIDR